VEVESHADDIVPARAPQRNGSLAQCCSATPSKTGLFTKPSLVYIYVRVCYC